MNWTLTVAQAVIITALSALISYLVSRRQKKLEYEYEYKKYILEKRKVAYEIVEKIITKLHERHINLHTGKPLNDIFFPTEENPRPLESFNIEIARSFKSSFWISDELLKQVMGLNSILHGVLIMLPENATPEDYRVLGEKTYPVIEDIRRELYFQYFNDLKKLDDVQSFKNKKEIM